jgi:hypothetical protein
MLTVYQHTNTGVVLQNNIPNVVVQLRVPNTGNYLVLGRVMLGNAGTTSMGATAFLTTLDGATVLDSVIVTVPTGGGSVCTALQGTLNVSAPNSNEIVDIRCASLNATALSGASANSCSLMVISVDQLSGSLSS